MGAHVVAFTTSESKRNAARALGADDVVVSRNDDEMAAHVKSFDFILNTVAAPQSRCLHHAAETRWYHDAGWRPPRRIRRRKCSI